MTYEEMMSIGKSCGLTSVGACYDNIERHYDLFFKIDNFNEEILKLQKDICKKNPEEFMKIFDVSEDLVKQWNNENEKETHPSNLICNFCKFEETLDDDSKEKFIGIFALGVSFGTSDGELCGLFACPKCKSVQMVTDMKYISMRKDMYKKQQKAKK